MPVYYDFHMRWPIFQTFTIHAVFTFRTKVTNDYTWVQNPKGSISWYSIMFFCNKWMNECCCCCPDAHTAVILTSFGNRIFCLCKHTKLNSETVFDRMIQLIWDILPSLLCLPLEMWKVETWKFDSHCSHWPTAPCVGHVADFTTHLWNGRLTATWETSRYCT